MTDSIEPPGERSEGGYGGPGPEEKKLRLLQQALEDAIEFREGRAFSPCRDCGPGLAIRCVDHEGDLRLIAGYRRRWLSGAREIGEHTWRRRHGSDT
jgi:hypothetical protein